MTFDPTKPVQTESGEKARVICSNVKGNFPIVAVIEKIDGSEYVAEFTKEGNSFCSSYYDSLINIPEPKPIDVHVGGIYKARDGDIGICFQKEESGSYRMYFLAKKDWDWTQYNGKFAPYTDDPLNLIEHLGDIPSLCISYIAEKIK